METLLYIILMVIFVTMGALLVGWLIRLLNINKIHLGILMAIGFLLMFIDFIGRDSEPGIVGIVGIILAGFAGAGFFYFFFIKGEK